MTLPARRLARGAFGLLLLPLLGATIWIGAIVFPSPLFAHSGSFGRYLVYSDLPLSSDFDEVVADLERRIGAMEHQLPSARQRIYLCNSRRYSFFSFLLRKNPESLATGLSLTRQTFVSRDRLRLFAEANAGRLRHTRFEGDPAEAVAHEIAHFHSVDALGYRVHLGQPVWKSEGWAEYQANLAAIRADPDYDLGRRIEQLLDDELWEGGRSTTARWLWESQVLVEYLGEVKGHRLTDLIRDEVTRSGTRDAMMAWYRER